MSQTTATYTASSMTILEGLAHVRKRPGMYIGGTGLSGLHHLVWEVVDNSVDEAMAGHCDRIDVTLLADGGCRVVDNGRGIPTDVHPEFKLTGVEIALTKLGGGGKFGGDGYKVSGGLHGVGVSVVNALSSRVVVQVDRGRQAPRDRVRRGRGQEDLAHRRGRRPPGPHRHHRHLLARRVRLRVHRVLGPHHARAVPDDGLPQQGPGDPVQGRARGPRPRAGVVPLRQRHRRLRQARQRHQEPAVQQGRLLRPGRGGPRGRAGLPVERRLPDRRAAQLRQRHRHHRGRHPRGGLPGRADHGHQQVRPGQGPAQGEGRQPGRRGRPRGPHRHHLGAPPRAPVRGPDQGQAGQPRDQDPGPAGHQRAAHLLARGAPHRGQQDRQEGAQRPAGPGRGPPGPRRHPPQVRPRRGGHARQAAATAPAATATSASCSSSRATPPAARPPAPATPGSRPSSPSGARSSTSSGPRSTAC